MTELVAHGRRVEHKQVYPDCSQNACEVLHVEVWTDESSFEHSQTVVRIRTPFVGAFARGLHADVPVVISGQL